MRRLPARSVVLIAFTSVACTASTSITIPPAHMSASREASAARDHDRSAAVLERQGTTSAETTVCGGLADGVASPICYSNRRPFGREEIQAMDQRRDAAEHRRVSLALHDAEARACQGVPEADREQSPFAYRDDIATVQILPRGARVAFRPIPGLTVAWLQRVVDCHLARNDALGHDVPEMSFCPLVPRGATATVSAWGDGYLVEVSSNDMDGAREIVRRSDALRP